VFQGVLSQLKNFYEKSNEIGLPAVGPNEDVKQVLIILRTGLAMLGFLIPSLWKLEE
jgi:hypothetical protein